MNSLWYADQESCEIREMLIHGPHYEPLRWSIGEWSLDIYQVFQVMPMMLQCENQIHKNSKHSGVLLVCSQMVSDAPVPQIYQWFHNSPNALS